MFKIVSGSLCEGNVNDHNLDEAEYMNTDKVCLGSELFCYISEIYCVAKAVNRMKFIRVDSVESFVNRMKVLHSDFTLVDIDTVRNALGEYALNITKDNMAVIINCVGKKRHTGFWSDYIDIVDVYFVGKNGFKIIYDKRAVVSRYEYVHDLDLTGIVEVSDEIEDAVINDKFKTPILSGLSVLGNFTCNDILNKKLYAFKTTGIKCLMGLSNAIKPEDDYSVFDIKDIKLLCDASNVITLNLNEFNNIEKTHQFSLDILDNCTTKFERALNLQAEGLHFKNNIRLILPKWHEGDMLHINILFKDTFIRFEEFEIICRYSHHIAFKNCKIHAKNLFKLLSISVADLQMLDFSNSLIIASGIKKVSDKLLVESINKIFLPCKYHVNRIDLSGASLKFLNDKDEKYFIDLMHTLDRLRMRSGTRERIKGRETTLITDVVTDDRLIDIYKVIFDKVYIENRSETNYGD